MAVGNNSYEMRVYKVGQPILPNRIAYNRVILTALYLVVLSTSVGMVAASDEGTFRIVPYSGQYGPPNGLTEGSPGVFYSNGGSANQAVFSVTPQGATSILATFTTSHYIQAPLVSAANGRFYSAISYAHNPVNAFSVGPAPDSLQLYPPQTLDPMPTRNLPDGTLLGIAVALSSSPASYLVKCDLEGNTTTIYQFPAGESLPHTAIYAGDGNYYGVSVLPDGSGYVYRVTPQGALAKLLNFPPKSFRGVPGYVPLLEAGDGNLYGATATGGVNGKGNIYKLTLGGQYTLLYTFPPSRRSFSPTALIEASDGNLYGATPAISHHQVRPVHAASHHERIYGWAVPVPVDTGQRWRDLRHHPARRPAGPRQRFRLEPGLAETEPQAAALQSGIGSRGNKGARVGSGLAFGVGRVRRSSGDGSVQ
jgi:uncharacterized repeat protein (TIGR03803 family)